MAQSIKYIAYIRKSTDEEKRQVTSLDAQRRELRDFAKRDRLGVVDTIEESRTAKEPGRPLFNRMLDRIERGEANGIIVWDVDRLYRNPVDEGRVRWMLQRGIIASIRTPTRSYFPADAGLLIAVEGGRATDFIIHHKRDVARGVREKLLRGEWPGQKPVGYIYDHRLRNIVPDKKRAKIVETIFQEVSGGRYSLLAVSDRLAQFGIRNKSGKQWSKSQIHGFLTNRLYTGVMVWSGETFEGKYKPIVSPELFKKVQDALKIRSKPRKVRNGHNFPFCGLFRCTCGSMISAQWAKGHGGLYRYYRCTRKTGVCSEPYTQEKSVADQCLEMMKPLAISPEQANFVRALIDEETQKDSQSLETESAEMTDKISAVQKKLNRLTQGFLDELIDEESYQASKSDLVIEKTGLKREKERLHRTRSSFWNEPAKEVINVMEMAGKMQTEKSPQEISRLVHKVGTNRLLSRKTVTFSFAEPYDFIPSLLASVEASTSTTSPSLCDAKSQSIVWCPRQDLNLLKISDSLGNANGNAQIDAQILVALGRDLSQVVTAWAKLPTALKAAILAIVNSAEGQP
jgi:DNA invertase Pin-like site-specific DNA recombinase